MKEFLDVTLLSALQGVAEFLPISSSGHLVIAQNALGINAPGVRLDVFLHVGTVGAIFAFYRTIVGRLLAGLFSTDAARRCEAWTYAAKVLVSALPTILVYVCFKHAIEGAFETPKVVGALLMFTGLLLMSTRFLPQGTEKVSFLRALLMGLGQAIAILPGVSRSGMTLAAARGARVAPESAAEFSFLMSVPLILGAALLEFVKDFAASSTPGAAPELSWGLVAYGAVVAAIVGYFSLAGLVKVLKGKWFWLFGPYCLLAGLVTLCFC